MLRLFKLEGQTPLHGKQHLPKNGFIAGFGRRAAGARMTKATFLRRLTSRGAGLTAHFPIADDLAPGVVYGFAHDRAGLNVTTLRITALIVRRCIVFIVLPAMALAFHVELLMISNRPSQGSACCTANHRSLHAAGHAADESSCSTTQGAVMLTERSGAASNEKNKTKQQHFDCFRHNITSVIKLKFELVKCELMPVYRASLPASTQVLAKTGPSCAGETSLCRTGSSMASLLLPASVGTLDLFLFLRRRVCVFSVQLSNGKQLPLLNDEGDDGARYKTG